MKSFDEWLDEVARVYTHFLPEPEDAPKPTGPRDPAGLRQLEYPGFRSQDIRAIKKFQPKFEELVSCLTKKFGLHFLAVYLPPEPDTKQLPIIDPERGGYIHGARRAYELGKPGWQKYQPFAQSQGKDVIFTFLRKEKDLKPTPTQSNTILYIKPTSRVHTLSNWQQVHNIGHAIWDYGKNEQGRMLAKFISRMRRAFSNLHYKKHGHDHSPNSVEIVILLSRMINIASFRRVVDLKPGQLNKASFRALSAFNNFREAMYELIATYMWNGCSLTEGRRPIEPIHTGKMEPNFEVQRAFHRPEKGKTIHPATWDELKMSTEEWKQVVKELEDIVGEAFKAVTYDKVGPIYTTHGYVTTTA